MHTLNRYLVNWKTYDVKSYLILRQNAVPIRGRVVVADGVLLLLL